MKILLVSAVYGATDIIKAVPRQHGVVGLEYACVLFSDSPASAGWQNVYLTIDEEHLFRQALHHKPNTRADVLKARFVKSNMLSLKVIQDQSVDFVIWVDGSIKITSAFFIMWQLNILRSRPVCFFKHNFLDNALEEVIHSSRADDSYVQQRYRHEPLQEQLQFFYQEGFTDEISTRIGHISSGIFGIRNIPLMVKFCQEWWKQIYNFSIHDQLCIGYLIWKLQLEDQVALLRLSITSSPYHNYVAHKKQHMQPITVSRHHQSQPIHHQQQHHHDGHRAIHFSRDHGIQPVQNQRVIRQKSGGNRWLLRYRQQQMQQMQRRGRGRGRGRITTTYRRRPIFRYRRASSRRPPVQMRRIRYRSTRRF